MRSPYVAPVSLLLAVGLMMGSSNLGWCAGNDKTNPVVAELGSHQITESDLEKKSPNDFAKAKSQLLNAEFGYYMTERGVLDKEIDDQLLADEAKKDNLTVDELLKREVDSKAKDPSEETLRIYYLATHSKAPYAEVRDKIKDTIRSLETAKGFPGSLPFT